MNVSLDSLVLAAALLAPTHSLAQRPRTAMRVHQLSVRAQGPTRGAGQTWVLTYHVTPPPGARLSWRFNDRGRPQVIRVSSEPGVVQLGSFPSPGDVTIRATDRAGRPIPLLVGGVTLSAVSVSTVGAPVQAPPPSGAAPNSPSGGDVDLVATSRACEAAFDGQRNEARCLRIMRARRGATAAIEACAAAFDGDRVELQCLESRAKPMHIETCAALFDGDRNELECARVLVQSRMPDTRLRELVQICSRRNGDRAEMECLREFTRRP